MISTPYHTACSGRAQNELPATCGFEWELSFNRAEAYVLYLWGLLSSYLSHNDICCIFITVDPLVADYQRSLSSDTCAI